MSVYDGKPLLASPGEFGESCETTCCRILHQQQGEVIKFQIKAVFKGPGDVEATTVADAKGAKGPQLKPKS